MAAIRGRFSQESLHDYLQLEGLLLKAVSGADFEPEAVWKIWGDNLNLPSLFSQLWILQKFSGADEVCLGDIIDQVKSMPSKDSFMSEVIVLLQLIIVAPAMNATSKRSFSALRRLKTYLRSTMTQQ